MAFTTFETTDLDGMSRVLKVQSDDTDTMDILQWDQTTNIVSSPNNRLSEFQVFQAQLRLDKFRGLVDPADLANMQYALGACCVIQDLTGEVSPLGVMSGTNSILRLIGFIPGQTAYVIVAIPHSVTPFQLSSPQ